MYTYLLKVDNLRLRPGEKKLYFSKQELNLPIIFNKDSLHHEALRVCFFRAGLIISKNNGKSGIRTARGGCKPLRVYSPAPSPLRHLSV